ncbi:hypothetical protein TNCV_4770331 [Trichonephila clavipes]|nr:hypothetical protein TNCV_4770331 [Trichonephila clavipes]
MAAHTEVRVKHTSQRREELQHKHIHVLHRIRTQTLRHRGQRHCPPYRMGRHKQQGVHPPLLETRTAPDSQVEDDLWGSQDRPTRNRGIVLLSPSYSYIQHKKGGVPAARTTCEALRNGASDKLPIILPSIKNPPEVREKDNLLLTPSVAFGHTAVCQIL